MTFPETSAPPVNGTADSTIHDLGYRRYEGAREGARGAFRALFWQGVRPMFGLGRPIKAMKPERNSCGASSVGREELAG